MKITQFDDTYTQKVGAGETTLVSGSSGGSNSVFGGDVTGSAGSLSVVGLRQRVSLSSNMGDNTIGTVLTTIQSSPWLATFAVASNSGGVSAGSNSTRVSATSAAGVAATYSPSDHRHDGIGTVTASSSNTLDRGTLNLRAGSNVALALSDSDGSGGFDTVTISATASGGGGGGTGNLTAPAAVAVDLGASNLLTRQAATNTEDDLFDSSPLNGKWLTYTGYNAVTDLTAKPGWCKITTAGAKLQAVPAGDWTIECEVIAAPTTSNIFTTGGLILTTGTTQSVATEARCSVGFNANQDQTRVFFEKFVNGGFSTTYQQHNALIGGLLPAIIRIIKSGTTYTVQFGPTREGLQYFFQTAGGLTFVPTHFGIHGDIGVYINGFYRL